ncbi:MAG: hypothetical protein AB1556_11120 [Bacillota bacterium]
MASPRKIHEWLLKALEEPFFRAEMHRVEMLRKNSPENKKEDRRGQRIEEPQTKQEEVEQCRPQKNTRYRTLSGKIFSR